MQGRPQRRQRRVVQPRQRRPGSAAVSFGDARGWQQGVRGFGRRSAEAQVTRGAVCQHEQASPNG